jgi:hypothetical protein
MSGRREGEGIGTRGRGPRHERPRQELHRRAMRICPPGWVQRG